MLRLTSKLAAVGALLMASAGMAWAQGGCVDSPENPTLVLGLLGAGAAGLPWLKAQVAARRKRHKD